MTKFHIASMSMQYTSAAVLLFIDQQKLKFDTAIGDLLPNTPGAEKITVRDLLLQQSGLDDINSHSGYAEILQHHQTPASLVAQITGLSPSVSPGTRHSREEHSAFNVLALLVEKKTGRPFPQAVEEILLQPLNLYGTYADDDGPEPPSVAIDQLCVARLVTCCKPLASDNRVVYRPIIVSLGTSCRFRLTELLPQTSWIAVYWKNGTLIPLTDGTESANAQSIFVSGSDVYVGGWENQTFRPLGSNSSYNTSFSIYWKNGRPVDLSNGIYGGADYSIFVSGSDVYSAGNSCDGLPNDCIASLWKNGIRTELLNQSNTNASSIVASGSDVYACGTLFNNPDVYSNTAVYWRNGVTVPLTDGTTQAAANQIAVSGSDVYIGGADSDPKGSFAQYWKNGTPVRLPGTQPASVSSITIVTH